MKTIVSTVNSHSLALWIRDDIKEIHDLHLYNKNNEIPKKIKQIRDKMEIIEKHLKTIEKEKGFDNERLQNDR